MGRHERVAEAIRKEASNIIHDELKDPRLGFVTVTRVELTPDLRHAKIFFSVLGKEEDFRKTGEVLNSALGFIRKLIAERINLRFAPEIAFGEDRSSEHSVRIQEILEQIKELNEPGPSHDKKGGKIMEPTRAKARGSYGRNTKAAFILALKGEDFGRRSIKEVRDEPKKSRRLPKKK